MCPWRSEAFAVLKIRLGVFVLGFRKPVGRMVECVQLYIYIHVVPRVAVFYRFFVVLKIRLGVFVLRFRKSGGQMAMCSAVYLCGCTWVVVFYRLFADV